jgi:hypothetical protein
VDKCYLILFLIKNNFFNNIWCEVMTIYACHIPLGKLYQYDMNVVHNMHTFGIKKNIQY